MAKKRIYLTVLISVILCTCLIAGCGEEESDSVNPNGEDTNVSNNNDSDSTPTSTGSWLVRKVIPDSPFKPPSIEGVVDGIVAELNKVPHNPQMKLSFMPKELTGFWETTIDGAADAFTELQVISTTVAPEEADVEDFDAGAAQAALIDERIAQGYAGIGVASHNDTIVPSIDAAVAAGMTVITFDSDEPDSARQLYIGTINTSAGKTGGETLANLLGANTGTVIVLGFDDIGWVGGYERTHAAADALTAAGQTVSIYHTDWTDQSLNEAGMVEIMQTADPPVIGCIGVFSNAHLCASAADIAGVADSVTNVAFDFEAETIAFMEAGKISATHVQRQYYMGYVVPYLLYASQVLGMDQVRTLAAGIMLDAETIDTGLDVVTPDTLDVYYTFMNSLTL
ncbi:MAG: substrate-binding domain-containing protein [Deltaproteobacteria bacterium]|nr:substrate-binding domain-containing protein [Deltaproteobacteria bacterium]